MNRSELISKIAEKTKMNKKDSNRALNAILETITETLEANDTVQLTGFGTFKTQMRNARKGINPQTKKTIEIPAKNAPVFKAGKTLKDAVK